MSIGESSSALGAVKGLGSAKHGGEHWLEEKVLSAALVLLGTWLIASLLFLPSLDRPTVTEWLRSPLGAVPMALFVIASFRHALDGLKVVVDDYVHDDGRRFTLNTLILFAAVGGAALALFALGRVAFGAAS